MTKGLGVVYFIFFFETTGSHVLGGQLAWEAANPGIFTAGQSETSNSLTQLSVYLSGPLLKNRGPEVRQMSVHYSLAERSGREPGTE